jgi:hypothetical protein
LRLSYYAALQSFCQDDNLSLVLRDVIDRFERLDFVVFVEGGGGEFGFEDDSPFDDDFPFDDDSPFDVDDSLFDGDDDSPFVDNDGGFFSRDTPAPTSGFTQSDTPAPTPGLTEPDTPAPFSLLMMIFPMSSMTTFSNFTCSSTKK